MGPAVRTGSVREEVVLVAVVWPLGPVVAWSAVRRFFVSCSSRSVSSMIVVLEAAGAEVVVVVFSVGAAGLLAVVTQCMAGRIGVLSVFAGRGGGGCQC